MSVDGIRCKCLTEKWLNRFWSEMEKWGRFEREELKLEGEKEDAPLALPALFVPSAWQWVG
jgi:hypothetical protein